MSFHVCGCKITGKGVQVVSTVENRQHARRQNRLPELNKLDRGARRGRRDLDDKAVPSEQRMRHFQGAQANRKADDHVSRISGVQDKWTYLNANIAAHC